MKKLLTGVAMAALIALAGSTTVSAAGHGCGRSLAYADIDGICGYYNTFCRFFANNTDNNVSNENDFYNNRGSGICGTGYIDADGDGVCDNIAAGTSKNGTAFQGRYFCGHGRHSGGHCRQGR